jgi:tetratricopeptide (TPR) repeat protein
MQTSSPTLDLLFGANIDPALLAVAQALHEGTNHEATATALNERGIARYLGQEPARALEDFDEALRLRPDYAEACNNRGVVRQRQGDLGGAVADFSRAVELSPGYTEAWMNRGLARLEQGDPAGLADLDEAVKTAPAEARAIAYHNRGAARWRLGDARAALADLDQAQRLGPGRAVTYDLRAQVREALGDLDGALEDCNRALALVPPRSAATILHRRGGVRSLKSDFAGAVADYDQALRIDPLFWVAYVSRANARYHRRDRLGLADYRRAYRINPEGTVREIARLISQDARRDAEGALANCDKHLRISAADAVARARRALILTALGRDGEAEDDLRCFREQGGPELVELVEHVTAQLHAGLRMAGSGPARPGASAAPGCEP